MSTLDLSPPLDLQAQAHSQVAVAPVGRFRSKRHSRRHFAIGLHHAEDIHTLSYQDCPGSPRAAHYTPVDRTVGRIAVEERRTGSSSGVEVPAARKETKKTTSILIRHLATHCLRLRLPPMHKTPEAGHWGPAADSKLGFAGRSDSRLGFLDDST